MTENKPTRVGSAELQVLLHYLDYAGVFASIGLSTFKWS